MHGKRFNEHRRHSRLFEKGDLKYVILDLVKDRPNHGYEIIRALEDRFYGWYTPSAGSIYPTLQMLEDMGYVTSSEQDGKKIYTITAEGSKFLRDSKEHVNKIKAHIKDWCGTGSHEEIHDVLLEIGRMVHGINIKMRHMDREQLSRVREIIVRTEREIDALV